MKLEVLLNWDTEESGGMSLNGESAFCFVVSLLKAGLSMLSYNKI